MLARILRNQQDLATIPAMANIKSSAKRARQAVTREGRNRRVKDAIKRAIKSFSTQKDAVSFQNLQKVLDKAAKVKVIHPHRAARVKSRHAEVLSAQSATSRTSA